MTELFRRRGGRFVVSVAPLSGELDVWTRRDGPGGGVETTTRLDVYEVRDLLAALTSWAHLWGPFPEGPRENR